jgi:hypothetical protein
VDRSRQTPTACGCKLGNGQCRYDRLISSLISNHGITDAEFSSRRS